MTVSQLIDRLKQLPDQNVTIAMQPGQDEPVLVVAVEGYPQYHHFPYAFIIGDAIRRPL